MKKKRTLTQKELKSRSRTLALCFELEIQYLEHRIRALPGDHSRELELLRDIEGRARLRESLRGGSPIPTVGEIQEARLRFFRLGGLADRLLTQPLFKKEIRNRMKVRRAWNETAPDRKNRRKEFLRKAKALLKKNPALSQRRICEIISENSNGFGRNGGPPSQTTVYSDLKECEFFPLSRSKK